MDGCAAMLGECAVDPVSPLGATRSATSDSGHGRGPSDDDAAAAAAAAAVDATARAQVIVAAAAARPDASVVAGLVDAYVAACPAVGRWLFGASPERPPIGRLAESSLVVRTEFGDARAGLFSQSSDVVVCQDFLSPYALGSIVDNRAVHPFATVGATLTGMPFGGTTVRRRFAIDLSSPIIEFVEVALSDDGRVIIHERRRLVDDDGATFSHEAIRWYLHRGVAGNDVPPPRDACVMQLLARPWGRSEVCRGCDPAGWPVRQPCPHVVGRVRGVLVGTFARWCAGLSSSGLVGKTSFEVQPFAATGRQGGETGPAPATAGVVAALRPVGYRYSFEQTDAAVQFFSHAARRAMLGGGDQPQADTLRFGRAGSHWQRAAAARNAAAYAGSLADRGAEDDVAAVALAADWNAPLEEVAPVSAAAPPSVVVILGWAPAVHKERTHMVPLLSGRGGGGGVRMRHLAPTEDCTDDDGAETADCLSTGGDPWVASLRGRGRPAETHNVVHAGLIHPKEVDGGGICLLPSVREPEAPGRRSRPVCVAPPSASGSFTSSIGNSTVLGRPPLPPTPPTGAPRAQEATPIPNCGWGPNPAIPASTVVLTWGHTHPHGRTTFGAPADGYMQRPGGGGDGSAAWPPSAAAVDDAVTPRSASPPRAARRGPPHRASAAISGSGGGSGARFGSPASSWPETPCHGASPALSTSTAVANALSRHTTAGGSDEGATTPPSDVGRPLPTVNPPPRPRPVAVPPTPHSQSQALLAPPPRCSPLAAALSSRPAGALPGLAPPLPRVDSADLDSAASAAGSASTPAPACPRPRRLRPRCHVCPTCEAAFISASDLRRHVLTVHHRTRQWPCSHCPYVALQSAHLTTHTAARHGNGRRFVCELCATGVPGQEPYRAVTRAAVERHVRRVHERRRPHACGVCGRAFAARSDLDRHVNRLHAGGGGGGGGGRGGGGGGRLPLHARLTVHKSRAPSGEAGR